MAVVIKFVRAEVLAVSPCYRVTIRLYILEISCIGKIAIPVSLNIGLHVKSPHLAIVKSKVKEVIRLGLNGDYSGAKHKKTSFTEGGRF